ncbi:MAG: TlpA family protein disulfide reductase [Flavobacteriaceae bacterium]|jgi:thiol-disulfide isomerase/thioredoxin|nr:TlpA family protein disulfide reductase [Flavobacteriaceae bacterium]
MKKIQNILKTVLCLTVFTISFNTTTWAQKATKQETSTITTSNTDATFIDANGKKVTLSSLKGKVVFVNFWATWCGPCIQEMPSIQALKDKMAKKNVVFLLVDIDGKYEKAKAFMDKKGLSLPVYIPSGAIPSTYLGTSIPTTVIFDKKGNMIQRIVGGVDYDSKEVEEFMNKVLSL